MFRAERVADAGRGSKQDDDHRLSSEPGRVSWGLILFISFGRGVGLIARAIMPGAQRTVMTIGLGIAGSFGGGFFASLLSGQRFGELHAAGFVPASAGRSLCSS